MRRRKPENQEKNNRSKPTTNSTHIKYRAGIEPRPHWWESRALTTAPALLCRLVSSVGRVPDCSAGGRGFEPQTGPTLKVLKQLRRTCCLCSHICKWLDVQVFLEKDYEQKAPSPAPSMLWLAGDIKEPTRLSLRCRA